MNRVRFVSSVVSLGLVLPLFAELPVDYGDVSDDISSGSVEGLVWTGAARAYKVDGEVVLVFTNTASDACSFEITSRYSAEGRYLLVAGGGAGGYTGEYQLIGAGGGAGGMVTCEDVDFRSGSYAVTVGAGGEPKGHKDWGKDENPNNNGTDSVLVFNGVVITNAVGGGAGGIPNGNWRGKLATGREGGSGGGSATMNGYAQSRGQGTAGQGNAGGKSVDNSYKAAGGGGGAGSVGNTASDGEHSGAGGEGKSSDITGEEVWYAGGGAGGAYCWYSEMRIAGGHGGGGDAIADTHDANSIVYLSESGTDGLGGGGAGASGGNGATGTKFTKSGRGGNGVVVVRFSRIREPEGPLDGVSFTGESEWYNIGKGKERETVVVFRDVDEAASLTLTRRATANILLVGGGGAGGNSGEYGVCGGGGGAGGLVETNGVRLSSGTYSVTIGKGGLPNKDCNTWEKSGNGTASILAGVKTRLTAFGGGGGGIGNGALNAEYAQGRGGDSIGSGGGGAYQASSGGQPGGVVDGSQGNNGGNHQGNGNNLNERIRCGAGGGGAGAAGANATQVFFGAAGGDGKPSSITGAEVWYAGGGAGGGYFNAPGVRKASGGNGGGGSSVITITQATRTLDPVSESGVDGLGGGGAGSCGAEGFGLNAAGAAGRGGNGIVVVRITEVSRPGILIFYR